MKDIRALAETNEDVKNAVVGSVKPVKELLAETFARLSLKGKSFKNIAAADVNAINSLWEELAKIDASVSRNDTTKAKIKSKPDLLKFLETHCLQQHYMFSIKSVGKEVAIFVSYRDFQQKYFPP